MFSLDNPNHHHLSLTEEADDDDSPQNYQPLYGKIKHRVKEMKRLNLTEIQERRKNKNPINTNQLPQEINLSSFNHLYYVYNAKIIN